MRACVCVCVCVLICRYGESCSQWRECTGDWHSQTYWSSCLVVDTGAQLCLCMKTLKHGNERMRSIALVWWCGAAQSSIHHSGSQVRKAGHVQ